MRHYLTNKLAFGAIGFVFVGFCLLATSACTGPKPFASGRGETPPQSPQSPQARPLAVRASFQEKRYEPVSATIPTIPKAEMLKDNDICMTCHEVWVEYHKHNIHRDLACEECHGPGSEHVRGRGQIPGTILSLKRLSPQQRNEVCLKCHEQDALRPEVEVAHFGPRPRRCFLHRLSQAPL